MQTEAASDGVANITSLEEEHETLTTLSQTSSPEHLAWNGKVHGLRDGIMRFSPSWVREY